MPLVILNAALDRPAWLDAATFKLILKNALWDVGLYWWEKILPKHFTQFGGAEYSYAKRKAAYTRRKLKKYGHTDPNVWTGRTKRALLARAGVHISSTSKHVTIKLRPGRGWRHRNFNREMTRVSRRDRHALAWYLVKILPAYMHRAGVVRGPSPRTGGRAA